MQEAYTTSFDERSKETRNTILALLLFLVEDCTFCHCVSTCGLTDLLVKVVCAHEVASPVTLGITPFSMQADDVCHEQIQLLWRILACMCKRSAESRAQIVSLGFMEVVLRYVKIDSVDMPVRSHTAVLLSPVPTQAGSLFAPIYCALK